MGKTEIFLIMGGGVKDILRQIQTTEADLNARGANTCVQSQSGHLLAIQRVLLPEWRYEIPVSPGIARGH